VIKRYETRSRDLALGAIQSGAAIPSAFICERRVEGLRFNSAAAPLAPAIRQLQAALRTRKREKLLIYGKYFRGAPADL